MRRLLEDLVDFRRCCSFLIPSCTYRNCPYCRVKDILGNCQFTYQQNELTQCLFWLRSYCMDAGSLESSFQCDSAVDTKDRRGEIDSHVLPKQVLGSWDVGLDTDGKPWITGRRHDTRMCQRVKGGAPLLIHMSLLQLVALTCHMSYHVTLYRPLDRYLDGKSKSIISRNDLQRNFAAEDSRNRRGLGRQSTFSQYTHRYQHALSEITKIATMSSISIGQ